MAKQVNVFAQNQPGRLERLTEVLLEEGINIRAITISGAEEYGVVKLLVDDPRKAFDALRREGFSTYLKEVIAVIMDDRPGGLHRVCRVLGDSGVNIEDAYGFVFQDRKTAILVVEGTGFRRPRISCGAGAWSCSATKNSTRFKGIPGASSSQIYIASARKAEALSALLCSP